MKTKMAVAPMLDYMVLIFDKQKLEFFYGKGYILTVDLAKLGNLLSVTIVTQPLATGGSLRSSSVPLG